MKNHYLLNTTTKEAYEQYMTILSTEEITGHSRIDLTDYTETNNSDNLIILSGFENGKDIYIKENAKSTFHSDSKIVIYVSDNVFTVDTSFLIGLLKDIVLKLGKIKSYENIKIHTNTANIIALESNLRNAINNIIRDSERTVQW